MRLSRRGVSTSATYRLFAQAMAERKQVLCSYGGYRRELCPIILGHTKGAEMALTYQFAGESSTVLPPEGQWRCLALANVSDASLRDGKWHSGGNHQQPSNCVEDVDLDINPNSPYRPRRKLQSL
jgi:hypothetical protein